MEVHLRHDPIGRIFSPWHFYRVPKYQRNYAWAEPQIEDFINDIVQCFKARMNGERKHHFFGGIVCVDNKVDGTPRIEYELVDGQQRIATFAILGCCLISQFNELKYQANKLAEDSYDETIEQYKVKLKNLFISVDDLVNLRPVVIDKVQLSEPDRYFFKQKLLGNNPNIRRESHKRIDVAFTMINEQLNNITNQLPDIIEKLSALSKIIEVLEADCTLIIINTGSRNEAYRLFQVLNDRGTGLTEGDLLRAKTLELLDNGNFVNQQSNVERAWDNILIDDKMTKVFLTWHFASIVGRQPKPSDFYDDYLENLLPEYKEVMSEENVNRIQDYISNLESEVNLLRKLIQGEWPYETNIPQINAWDKDRLTLLVKELDHSHCMPLLLAATKLSQDDFSNIVQMLERFFFRFKVVCNAHVGSLAKVYLQHAVMIRNNPESYDINSLRTSLRDLINTKANDETFLALMDNKLVYSRTTGNKPIKYFLMTLEHYLRWFNNGANGLPACLDKTRVFNFSVVTIEHIYPQNADIDLKNDELEEVKNIVGNLTFLGPNDNDAAGNKSFSEKKQILAGSLIALNTEIASNDTWNRDSVLARQERLKQIALKVFSVK